MKPEVFKTIMNELESKYPFFQQKRDASGYLSFHPYAKGTAAMRMLAYGGPADAVDEYLKMGESTVRSCLINFCNSVIECFGEKYLRSPDEEDLKRLLAEGEKRGFPGMLGSIDCMHWEWKNCPTAWQGMYTGKEHTTTLILEAVASYDLWIWHSFGVPGSSNDITVLYKSPVFDEVINGQAPSVKYSINGHEYTMGYYLADGFYPSFTIEKISSILFIVI